MALQIRAVRLRRGRCLPGSTRQGVTVRIRHGSGEPCYEGAIRLRLLFTTGNKEEFSPTTAVDERVKPAATLAFRCEQPLRAGKNVFGCRAD